MLWAAAMGIKVGGLSRTVAQPRPHADRLPNEDSSCDSRHECVQRATTRLPLACTVCSTRVRAGIRAKFCTIMLGISSTGLEADFLRIVIVSFFIDRVNRVNLSSEKLRTFIWSFLRYFHYNILMQMYKYTTYAFWKYFNLKYIFHSIELEERNSKSSRCT